MQMREVNGATSTPEVNCVVILQIKMDRLLDFIRVTIQVTKTLIIKAIQASLPHTLKLFCKYC
jgi:hypothetical protein